MGTDLCPPILGQVHDGVSKQVSWLTHPANLVWVSVTGSPELIEICGGYFVTSVPRLHIPNCRA